VSSSPVTFESLDGLTLEGHIAAPAEPGAALVLCHPHPQMGGTMAAPLLEALEDHLVDAGWAVLRFNFRGIGASEGEPSTGDAETEDAAGALDVVRKRFGGLPIAIAGWSFGAGVAVRVAVFDEALVGTVAIAPAVETRQGITEGLPEPEGLSLPAPLLIVCGANDEVVSPQECRTWAARVANADYIELKGSNHFFWAHYEVLATTVTQWLDELLH